MQLVDYDVLRDLAGVGDSGGAYMAGLMEAFASDARAGLLRMRACAREGDAQRLAREAHRLKGSSGTVGAVALAGECLDMERCARSGSCTGIEARVEGALTLLEATRIRFSEFFRGNIAAQA